MKINKTKQKGQSKTDNSEKLSALGTQDEDKQNKTEGHKIHFVPVMNVVAYTKLVSSLYTTDTMHGARQGKCTSSCYVLFTLFVFVCVE
jgi:hypothetical protein